MSAGGTGGVGGRREKTTALADECDSRCGACAATLTDEELEGGTGGTGSLSAHTGGPISSHSRASLCTRFAICLAQKSPPRRSPNPSRRRVLGRQAPHDTPRIGTVSDQLALPYRVAPRAKCAPERLAARLHGRPSSSAVRGDGFVVADVSEPHAATVLLCCLQTGAVTGALRLPGAQLLASNRRPEGSQCGSDRRRRPCLFPTFCGSKAIML